MPEAFYELLWYDPTVAPVDPATSTPTSAYFPDLGQVTARTGWHDTATLLSVKAAPGGGHTAWETAHRLRAERGWETLNAGHHHPDAGSFVLFGHGAFLAVEDGYSNRKKAAHHNLVLVDGHGWAGEDRYHVYEGIPFERQPRLRDVLLDGGFAHATAESAAMFDPALGVRRCDRTVVFTPSGRLVLLDLLEADQPRQWTVLLHSDHAAEPVDETTFAVRSGPGLAWVRLLAGPEATTWTRTDTEVEANPTSSTPNLRITSILRTLRIETVPTATAALLTTLEPADALDPIPASAVRADCEGGYGVRFADGETVLLSPLQRRITCGGVTANAAAVLVSGARRLEVPPTQTPGTNSC
jgi:hypothetical protein